MLEHFLSLFQSIAQHFRAKKTDVDAYDGRVSRGLQDLEDDVFLQRDAFFADNRICSCILEKEEIFPADLSAVREKEDDSDFLYSCRSSDRSFSVSRFGIQRDVLNSFVRKKELSRKASIVENARTFAPESDEDPIRCWGRISTLNKQMSEKLIVVGPIARLFLARMKKQRTSKSKNSLFLMESISCLGVSSMEEFPLRLDGCISQFETVLNAMETAFQSGDLSSYTEQQTKLREISALLPVHIHVWETWYKQLKKSLNDGIDETDLLMSKDEIQAVVTSVDDFVSEWKKLKMQLSMFNYGLCISAANTARTESDNIWEDLVSDCFLKLGDVIDHFDYTRGLTFSNYAMFILKHYVKENLNSRKTVPVSNKDFILRAKILKYSEMYEMEYHVAPSEAHLATVFQVSEKKIHQVLLNAGAYVVDPGQEHGGVSDQDGEVENPVEVISDPKDDPAESVVDAERHQGILLAIGSLSQQQRKVVVMYYGLYDSPTPNVPMTKTEIARRLGLSNPRVGELFAAAMGHLKSKMSAYKR